MRFRTVLYFMMETIELEFKLALNSSLCTFQVDSNMSVADTRLLSKEELWRYTLQCCNIDLSIQAYR